jgi:hypothetical protein
MKRWKRSVTAALAGLAASNVMPEAIADTAFDAASSAAATGSAGAEVTASPPYRQALADAWWTGPLLAASAATLPKGHVLIEPYLFDVITRARFDDEGNRLAVPHQHNVGSLTYMLYGLTDRVTVGLIPTFSFRYGQDHRGSSGIGFGDLQLQGQVRLTQFREGRPVPTISLVVGETLPTGRYHRLDRNPNDGTGSGVHTTTLSLYSQHYFWMPNGRILRTRLDLSYAFSDTAHLEDTSVYGTSSGFRGSARPGDSFVADLAFEYSMTRNWVLALDIVHSQSANTRLRGRYFDSPQLEVRADSGTSRTLYVAPAIEYNFNGNVGVIAGVRLVPDGRNTSATITPVAAINLVY